MNEEIEGKAREFEKLVNPVLNTLEVGEKVEANKVVFESKNEEKTLLKTYQ